MPLQRRGNDDYNDDVRWEEQDMPYLSCDWQRAEGGEGNVNDSIDDDHVDGRVRGPHLADTGNGRRWRLRRDGNNDNDVEEGGSHPTTPQTTAMHELVARLCSAGILYASEASLLDHLMMMKRGVMLANYGNVFFSN